MAVGTLVFKESPLSPWALWGRSKSTLDAGGRRQPDSLPADAMPPAIKTPSEVIGCISYVNSYISKAGLHRRNTLPPIIFDLFSPPPNPPDWRAGTRGASKGEEEEVEEEVEEEEEEEEEEEGSMAHRRGKPIRRKKIAKHPEFRPPSVDTKENKIIEKISPRALAADSLLVELATYPGYDPTMPTPLPHGMATLELMRRVISAQVKLATKQEGYRDVWCKLFYSQSSQDIVLDYYWWFFLHKYQTNQLVIQDLLFSRISNNYVNMLCQPAEMKLKDSFFKTYPNIIAQCVYSAFIYAYPNSWNGFDDDFKAELCMYISEWQVGTKPSAPSSWKLWDLTALEPPNLPKRRDPRAFGGEDIGSKLKAQGKFDLDVLVKEAKETKQKETEKRIMAKLEASFGRKFSVMAVKRALSGSKCAISALISPTLPPSGKQPTEEEFASSQDGILTTASEERRITLAIEQLAAIEKASTSRVRLLAHPSSKRYPGKPITSPLSFLGHQQISPSGISPPLSPRRSGSLGMMSFVERLRYPQPAATTKSALARRRGAFHAIKITKMDESDAEAKTDEVASEPPFMVKQSPLRLSSQEEETSRVVSGSRSKSPIAASAAGGDRESSKSPDMAGAMRSKSPSSRLKKTKKLASYPGQLGSTHTKKKSHSAHPKLNTMSRQRSSRKSFLPATKSNKGQSFPSPLMQRAATATPTPSKAQGGRIKTGELKKMALSFKDRPASSKRTESATLKGPEFERVMFNLHGHSPLVKHYLNTMKLSHVNEKEVVVGRTEISEEPPHDAVCYRDILTESKAVGDKNQELFDKHYAQQKNSMISADRRRQEAKAMHEKNVKLVLANRKEIQTLSNELAAHALQPKSEYSTKVAVDDVIQRTLKRANLATETAAAAAGESHQH